MHARAKGKRDVTITYEEFEALFKPMTCAVTGMPLSWSKGERGPWSPSVDRIDSSKGYIPGNVRVTSMMYNLAKSEWTDENVREMALWLLSPPR